MAELPLDDLAKNWPLLVGNSENPDQVTVVGFEDNKGRPLKGCKVILETPSGDRFRLGEGENFHLQIVVQYNLRK